MSEKSATPVTCHPWVPEILALLNAEAGTTTGHVAQRHSQLSQRGNRRQQAASALALLRQLEAAGLIKQMDNEKPIAWLLAETPTEESRQEDRR